MRFIATQLAAATAVFLVSSCATPKPVAAPAAAPPKAERKAAGPRSGIVSTISLASLFELQQAGRVLVFDARPGFVYAFGHLPAAVNWPRGLFDSERPQHESEVRQAIAKNRSIVVYCTDAACPDAGEVARRISALGYSVSILEGGFAAWKEAGLPIE